MKGKKSGSAALWVLAALLLAAAVAGFFAGVAAVGKAGRGSAWHLKVEGLAATALRAEDLPGGDPARAYYQLEFQLTNNSNRRLLLDPYYFTVRPVSGDKYAVRVLGGEENAQFSQRPAIPIGASGPVRLVLEVRPEEIEGSAVKLVFDEYGDEQLLGTVELP